MTARLTNKALTRPARPIRIATRKSDLALWQANWTRTRLEALGAKAELVLIDTQGDRTQSAGTPFRLMPGQGFFTKAVQDAVLAGEADVAVHSHKDLPSAPTPGLEVAAVSEREDARDVLLVRPEAWAGVEASKTSSQGKGLADGAPSLSALPLKAGTRIGTSAARRRAQLGYLRPDLEVAELRGNVPSRIRKLRGGEYGAIVLAAAGLVRLGLELPDLEVWPLEPSLFVPAPAQGALALEIRRGDDALASLLTELHSARAYKTVAAERGLMGMLRGGCQLALGAYAVLEGELIELTAWYEGAKVTVTHPSSEGAAYLAFEALGRPAPAGLEAGPETVQVKAQADGRTRF